MIINPSINRLVLFFSTGKGFFCLSYSKRDEKECVRMASIEQNDACTSNEQRLLSGKHMNAYNQARH